MYNQHIVIVTLLSLGLQVTSGNARAEATDWEIKQLHQPSEKLIELENAGRITIFDGLPVTEVDRALDKQFDRIDAMMFIRTLHPTAAGDFEADDDCD